MPSLIEVYEEMQKSAQEANAVQTQEVVPTPETAVAPTVDNETLEVLNKYAEAAEAYLKENFESYNDDHIVKVAQEMMEYDAERFEQMEKVAELHEAGIIMAKAFKQELANQ